MFTQLNTEEPLMLNINHVQNPICFPVSLDWILVWYLEAFEQRSKQREACNLVDPLWLLADDMAEQGDGGETAALLAHAFIHLIQKMLYRDTCR